MKQYIIFIFLFTSNFGFAQTQLSLGQAIQRGLKNNYQIQIAEKDTEIAKINNTDKATGKYPSINLNLSSGNSFARSNGAAAFITNPIVRNTLTANVDVAWTLFDGHKARINKTRLEELQRQSEGNANVLVENTIQQIILAYYNALIQKEQLGVLKSVIQLSREKVGYQELRREYGQAGTFDVLQSEDAYLIDSTNLLLQTQNYETALRNLNIAMNEVDINKSFNLIDKLNFVTENYDISTLEKRLLDNNKDLRQLYVAQALTFTNTKLQESNQYPTVRLNTGADVGGNFANIFGESPNPTQEFKPTFGSDVRAYVNITATYTLFDAGQRNRNIQVAKVQEKTAQLRITDLKYQLQGRLKNTLETYNNQKALLALTERVLKNAEKNIEIAEARYSEGLLNSFDYRTIQLSYINASQNRLNAVFNLRNTEVQLMRLTGDLVRK